MGDFTAYRSFRTPTSQKNIRPIFDDPKDKDGHFRCPKSFTAEDEVRWAKVRLDTARISSYQDTHCGSFPNTYDPTGAYLCRGCNKITPEKECLIRIDKVQDPTHSSCGYWETINAGDPEVRYCKPGKRDDKRIAFGTTPNDAGFGCQRCEYGQQTLPQPDSEGRALWCKLKGHPVEEKACCADNEPE